VIGAGGPGCARDEPRRRACPVGLVCKSLLGKRTPHGRGASPRPWATVARGQLAGALPRHDARRPMVNNWRMAQLHAQSAEARPRARALGALFDRTKDASISQRDFGGIATRGFAHVAIDRPRNDPDPPVPRHSTRASTCTWSARSERLMKDGDRISRFGYWLTPVSRPLKAKASCSPPRIGKAWKSPRTPGVHGRWPGRARAGADLHRHEFVHSIRPHGVATAGSRVSW